MSPAVRRIANGGVRAARGPSIAAELSARTQTSLATTGPALARPARRPAARSRGRPAWLASRPGRGPETCGPARDAAPVAFGAETWRHRRRHHRGCREAPRFVCIRSSSARSSSAMAASGDRRRIAVECRTQAPLVGICAGRIARAAAFAQPERRHAGQRERSWPSSRARGRAGRLPAPAPRRGRCRGC